MACRRQVRCDRAEAVRLYQLAAAQGHVQAMVNLGVLHATGRLGGVADRSVPRRARRIGPPSRGVG
jgi:TPR repeat protein